MLKMNNVFSFVLSSLITFCYYLLFKPVFDSSHNFSSSINLINLIIQKPDLFFKIKISFLIITFFTSFFLVKKIFNLVNLEKKESQFNDSFSLLIGYSLTGDKIYISEKSLYQNMLITGSIGCGKTSSAMYPFTRQLLTLKSKPGFLILDVKGNYYKQVLCFAEECSRDKEIVIIELGGNYRYNPLDKPSLNPSIIANRLKSILLLFSPNNSESYWLDIAEQVIESSIILIRAYNSGFVNFIELHKFISDESYFKEKLKSLREAFVSNRFSQADVYNISNAINYLKTNYYSLDSRTFNILRSDISRITNPFVSDFDVMNTFCPSKDEENFFGFDEVISEGKIVVLNMNIAKYRNLSKIIAAYLKLDFQTDVLKQLSNPKGVIRPMCFISDEYQEYVTANDADFYAKSREAKCINIVATQSYTSLLNTLSNQNTVKVIVQNLVNKLWFRSDDIFTIEDIQKQIGKEEKTKTSTTYSENSKHSDYNFLTKNFTAIDSNLSESVNSYSQFEYIYDYNFFTQNLETFTCVGFLLNDSKIMKPQKISMIPYFKQKGDL